MGEGEQEEALSHDAGTRREEGGITSVKEEGMRTIKYRQPISERHGGGWHYWGYIEGNLNSFIGPLSSNDGTIRESYQSTGILDANGKEIFEGCIMSEKGYVAYSVNDGRWFFGDCPLTDLAISLGNLKIIGDTYNNPDLIY
jgi:hypothetical protein